MLACLNFPIKKYYQVIFVFFPACNDVDDIGTPTLLRKKRLFMKIPLKLYPCKI